MQNNEDIEPFSLFMFFVMLIAISWCIGGIFSIFNIGYGVFINTIIVIICWLSIGLINGIKG